MRDMVLSAFRALFLPRMREMVLSAFRALFSVLVFSFFFRLNFILFPILLMRSGRSLTIKGTVSRDYRLKRTGEMVE